MHSSALRSPFELDLGHTQSVALDIMVVQPQYDGIERLEYTVFVERLQATLLDAQDNIWKAQHGQMPGANLIRRPWTIDVRGFVMMISKYLQITYAIQDPS